MHKRKLALHNLPPAPRFSVFTPQSVRSPTPGQAGVELAARVSRSPTPSLNFQTLSLVDPQPPSSMMAVAEEVTKIFENIPQISSTDAGNGIVMANNTLGTLSAGSSFEMREELTSISGSPEEAEPTTVEEPHLASPSAAWPTAAEEATESQVTSYYPWKREVSQVARAEAETQTQSTANLPQRVVTGPPVISRPLRKRKGPSYRADYIWFCESCALSDSWVWSGGMTTMIDHCPECGHLRCTMCRVERVETIIGA